MSAQESSGRQPKITQALRQQRLRAASDHGSMTVWAASLQGVQRVPLAACPPVPQRITPRTDTGRQAASGTPPPIGSWTLRAIARMAGRWSLQRFARSCSGRPPCRLSETVGVLGPTRGSAATSAILAIALHGPSVYGPVTVVATGVLFSHDPRGSAWMARLFRLPTQSRSPRRG